MPLESAVRARVARTPEEASEALLRFYEARGFQPAWFSQDGSVRPQVDQYLAALCEAPVEGLWPERYHRSALDEAVRRLTLGGAPEGAWVEVEVRLTSSFLTYASHLLTGQVSPRRFAWRTKPPGDVDLATVLEGALVSGDLAGALRELSPSHEGFVRLREALVRYRALAAEGGWPLVPEGGLLQRGMRGPRVAVLRERLRATGDLPPAPEERLLHPGAPAVGVVPVTEELIRASLEGEAPVPAGVGVATGEGPGEVLPAPEEFFDAELEEAVRAFQRRLGLEVDGLVGRNTLRALRVPVEERIAQMRVNLERWRWVPRSLGVRYVVVNLPAFELEAVEQGRPVLKMRTIIGTRDWRTPIFMDEVEYLVLNPVWYLPSGISTREVLPRLQEDPGAAERMELTIYERATGALVDPWAVDWNAVEAGALPYRFEQSPGDTNPLGRVKFIFPNRFSVYLHDTPNPALFERTHRAFSHGCIRVEEPVRLADFMLRGHGGWTRESLAAAMEAGGEPRRVVLPAPVPVYLLYWTAFVDAEGRVQFRPDLYRRDPEVRRALALETPRVAGESPASCGGVRG
ncbi:L,D-transpeptidase family protein [Archangium violaceum]|uniref:L,D-transpeptidase family protein n=1 Tax=Archangium violaceum TaxID=83451 RepID=UPI0005B9ADD8|nr:L,D-transpeptidase family protein [Archangium violaceum]